MAAKVGVPVAYDLWATPFFLRGSGYGEGTLFPWVVSDFSLIDAIESGLVKIPRVPVSDDRGTGDLPAYRSFWGEVADQLPKRGRPAEVGAGGHLQPLPPSWRARCARSTTTMRPPSSGGSAASLLRGGGTPPVFIVVCSNTAVSKWVYDTVAGYEAELADGTWLWREGEFPPFTNVDDRGELRPSARTILVDSREIESGAGLSDAFQRASAQQIIEFKAELRARFPGRDTDDLGDDALIREVLNTVGRAGRLGEHIRCVVSVSMLTEGWDANTVTHILGVRAFGTQLLCEQVVGRGLRRRSYAVNDEGLLEPEYAEVYAIPFSFIPGSGKAVDPKPPRPSTHVRALPGRTALSIRFPHVVGYRLEVADAARFGDAADASPYVLSKRELPTTTTVSGVVGESKDQSLDSLRAKRPQEVAFRLAQRLLDRHLRSEDGHERPWFFPQVLPLVRDYLEVGVELRDDTFLGLLLLGTHADAVIERLGAVLTHVPGRGRQTLHALLRPFDHTGTTDGVGFDTTKTVQPTTRSHVSHVVADSDWEGVVADVLESLDEVEAYVKNDRLGFSIPYTIDGQQRAYLPDFLVRARVAEGAAPLTVIVEVSGERRRDKAEKVRTARERGVPAVEQHGGYGRWRFIEVTDPWDCKDLIRGALAG